MTTPTAKNVADSADIEVTISSTDYVPVADDLLASEFILLNNTGQNINIRRDNGTKTGTPYLCKDGTFKKVDGIVNLNQVKVALAGGSTPATVQGTYYA